MAHVIADASRLLLSLADTALRRDLLVASCFTLSFAALCALTPLLFKQAVDALAGGSPAAAPSLPFWLIGAYMAAVCLLRLFGDIRMQIAGTAEKRLQRCVTRRTVAHVLDLPARFLADSASGALGQIINDGLMGYQILVRHLLITVLPMAVELLAVAIVLCSLQHSAYLVLICVGAAVQVAIYVKGANVTVEPAREATAANVRAQAALTDAFMNSEIIKQLNAQGAVAARHDAVVAITENHWRNFFLKRRGTALASSAVFCMTLGAALFFATFQVSQGSITVGDLVLIQLYLARFTAPLELLGQAIRDGSQAIVWIEKLFDLLAISPESSPTHSARHSRGGIQFVDVNFEYAPARGGLCNVNHTIPAGTTVALVGASGSGKSTLAKLLIKLYRPDSGQILLDETPLEDWSVHQLRDSVALVPQDTILFNESLSYNISVGRPESSMAQIEVAAAAAGLEETIARLPEGLNTPVGERGLKLSAGERQRVAIARALLRQPRVYVFDEATSSLDSKLERQIMERLRTATAGCTVLLVAHRLASITHADQILVFDHGRIIERGTHQQLLSNGGAYAHLWGAQAQIKQHS